ncbi:hypothetical protein JCM10207_009081 [Rhodosporidiobolus poonsookiae]
MKGMVIYGPPGVGKSLSLYFFLSSAIEELRPVVFWAAREPAAFIFTDGQVYEYPAASLSKVVFPTRVLVLVDAVSDETAVPSYIRSMDNAVFVLTSSPQSSRCIGFAKQTRACFWHVGPWQTTELQLGQSLARLLVPLPRSANDPEDASSLYSVSNDSLVALATLDAPYHYLRPFTLPTDTGLVVLTESSIGNVETMLVRLLKEQHDSEETGRTAGAASPLTLEPSIDMQVASATNTRSPVLSATPSPSAYTPEELWAVAGPIPRTAMAIVSQTPAGADEDILGGIDFTSLAEMLRALIESISAGFSPDSTQHRHFHSVFVQIPRLGYPQLQSLRPRSSVAIASAPIHRRLSVALEKRSFT